MLCDNIATGVSLNILDVVPCDNCDYGVPLQRRIGLIALRPRLAWLTKPKNLLLLDSIGAAMTSLSTGLLLTIFIPTGLPVWVLWMLSIIAAGFACLDLVAYYFRVDACRLLAIIGMLNLLYLILTIATCLIYLQLITNKGVIYLAVASKQNNPQGKPGVFFESREPLSADLLGFLRPCDS